MANSRFISSSTSSVSHGLMVLFFCMVLLLKAAGSTSATYRTKPLIKPQTPKVQEAI